MTFPFRLGTTSYILHGNIIPNAKYLAGKVDDMQLILFESEDVSLPTEQDIQTLKTLSAETGLTYSIHFPLDTVLGANEPLRSESVKKHIEIINLTAPLEPSVYIVHFNGDNQDHRSGDPSEDMPRWLANNGKSMKEIIAATAVDPAKLCIETLAYPLSLVDDIIEELHLSVCLDIGHLILNSYSLEEHFDRYLSKTRSIHLHGTSGTKDHIDLSYMAEETLDLVLARMADIDINLTIEVFSRPDLERSLDVLRKQYS